jgi:hypothetical protein
MMPLLERHHVNKCSAQQSIAVNDCERPQPKKTDTVFPFEVLPLSIVFVFMQLEEHVGLCVQQGYSQSTVASTVESGYQGMDRKLKEISQRVRKHLGHNPRLLNVTWDALQATIMQQLQHLQEDVRASFPEISIPIPAEQVAQLLKGVTP